MQACVVEKGKLPFFNLQIIASGLISKSSYVCWQFVFLIIPNAQYQLPTRSSQSIVGGIPFPSMLELNCEPFVSFFVYHILPITVCIYLIFIYLFTYLNCLSVFFYFLNICIYLTLPRELLHFLIQCNPTLNCSHNHCPSFF